MMEQVRVGVIGTSWYADLAHLPRLKSHPGAKLAAICGRNGARAEEMAVKYGIPLVFTDYRAMVEKGDLDAVIVSTPDDLHYPMTMDALDAGLHVLCEKPMALNRTQAREMYEKAEDAGVRHMVCFTYRWMPHYRYLKHLVDQATIGRCFHCRFSYLAGYGRSPQYGWGFDRRRALGVLGNLGSHMIDLARWVVGEVARVSACVNAFVERPGPGGQALDPANDTACLAVEFANGAQGLIEVSAVAQTGSRGQEQHVRLYGESGTLKVDWSFAGEELRGIRNDEQEWKVLTVADRFWEGIDRTRPYLDQLAEVFSKHPVGDRLFIDAILQDRPAVPSFYDGLKAQEVIDAALESHEQGEWVSLRTT